MHAVVTLPDEETVWRRRSRRSEWATGAGTAHSDGTADGDGGENRDGGKATVVEEAAVTAVAQQQEEELQWQEQSLALRFLIMPQDSAGATFDIVDAFLNRFPAVPPGASAAASRATHGHTL